MSLFSSESSWGGQCSSPNQSPINLSQSGAKECHLTCELVMDDGYTLSGNVFITNEALALVPIKGYLGSCKFNGDGYNCIAVSINHPSHHTIEGVQADGECIAIFQNATGNTLCVSSLFRVNPTHSDSLSFFRQFVPYAHPTDEITPVALNDWGLYKMVPPAASYFVYDGSYILPGCGPTKWVVFKQMINMDPGDFAYLVKTLTAGSRPIKPLGDREVFFNDSENLAGGPVPHDNKTYIRCRGGKKSTAPKKPVQKVDLKSTEATERENDAAEKKNPTTTSGKASKAVSDYAEENGWISVIGIIILLLGAVMGLYYGYSYSRNLEFTEYIPKKMASVGAYIRSFFIKKPVPVIPAV